MTPKTTILLVRMVCYFIYHIFVNKDPGLAKLTLDDMYTLAQDQTNKPPSP